jgi:hypothetical protein
MNGGRLCGVGRFLWRDLPGIAQGKKSLVGHAEERTWAN